MKQTQKRVINQNKTKKNKRIIPKQKLEISAIQSKLNNQRILGQCMANVKPFEREFGQNVHEVSNVQKALLKVIRKKFVPTSVFPNNDFYTYINYEWMKYTQSNNEKNENYIVQFDDFRIVQNKVYHELIDMVKRTIQGTSKSKKEKEIANVYKAGLRLLDDKQARQHLQRYVSYLDEQRSKDDPWTFLGTMNQNEIVSFGLPFVLSLTADEKDSKTFRCHVYSPQFSLVDLQVYFADGKDVSYKANYKRQFLSYVNKLFIAFYGKNHGFRPQDVFDVEFQLLNLFGCQGEKEGSYFRVSTQEAMKKYGFDWATMTRAFGFTTPPPFFIVNNLNYVKCGSDLVKKTFATDNAWRTYYVYIYMRQLARFHPKWRVIVYEFCGRFMRGQAQIFPHELMPVFNLSFSFNTFLTNAYIEEHANPLAIQYVQTLAEDMRLVFKRIIERNRWLQPSTKRSALKKLDNFHFEIGSPPLLREDPLLHYTADDVWENFSKIIAWRSHNVVQSEGQPLVDIPIIDWNLEPFKLTGTQAYVVNAYYTPTKNGIYIPLAYFQKPFVDLDERGIEYNLATVGFTIGHEMSHSLDDTGSQYDEKGNMNNWWTPTDHKIFERKQKDVIREYEEFAKRDGIDFDASMSIGEDLADISGVAICLEYLRDFLEKNKEVIPIRVLSFKMFLVYFAFGFKQKIKKQAIKAQIRTNPHPLDKYRTNVPLSRLEIFRDLYEVKKGDGMYWPNADTIW